MGGGKYGWSGGGGGNVNVLESTSLISQREGKRQEVDDTLTVLRDVYNDYGVTVNTTVDKLSDPRVMAYYSSDGNIGVNQSYFNAQALDGAYDGCIAKGFHPPRGNKTGMEATVAHEAGHAVTQKLADRYGRGFDDISMEIVKKSAPKAGYRSSVLMAKSISGYAKHSPAEAIAEAFSDVYCNGRRAKKESKAIVNTMNDYLGGRS